MAFGRAIRVVLLAAALAAAWFVADGRGRAAKMHAAASVRLAGANATPTEPTWAAIARRSATSTVPATVVRDSRPLPEGPFGPNVAALKERAEAGDPGAARSLADGFRRCRFYQPSQNREEISKRAEDHAANSLSFIDQFVDQLRDKGVDTSKIPQPSTTAVYNDALQQETALDADCRDVAHDEAANWLNWYGRSAALGDRDARVGYLQAMFQQAAIESYDTLRRQKADAAMDLQRAFEDGDPRALDAIAFAFRNGLYGEPDPFLAYAYDYAASLAPDAASSTLPGLGGGMAQLMAGPSTQRYYVVMLRLSAGSLDAERIAAAEALGRSLYAQCCERSP